MCCKFNHSWEQRVNHSLLHWIRLWLLRQSPAICFLLCCLACVLMAVFLVQSGVRHEALVQGGAL